MKCLDHRLGVSEGAWLYFRTKKQVISIPTSSSVVFLIFTKKQGGVWEEGGAFNIVGAFLREYLVHFWFF